MVVYGDVLYDVDGVVPVRSHGRALRCTNALDVVGGSSVLDIGTLATLAGTTVVGSAVVVVV